ncbi:MAG: hypothetical protein ACUVTR_02820 [Dehalococcoidia bacterium]
MLETLGLSLGTVVLILGIFFIIVGIIVTGVVYRESREWKKMILPMFDRYISNTGNATPESPEEPNKLALRLAAFGKEIFSRFFSQIDVAGLLGGAATVILGILIVLIGLTLGD